MKLARLVPLSLLVAAGLAACQPATASKTLAAAPAAVAVTSEPVAATSSDAPAPVTQAPSSEAVVTTVAAAPVTTSAAPVSAPKVATTTAAPVTAAAPPSAAAPAGAETYQNCTAMHADYPHGVGEPGAVDHTSGKPVTDFYVSQALYDANTKSDADHDGIACEKA